MSPASLDERLAALREAAGLGEERLEEEHSRALAELLARADRRRALSGRHTVVGFFGATGSGKSSLFNAVVGADLARAHVRRPTTSQALAAVWDRSGAEPLLDWLEVRERHEPSTPFAGREGLSLILLDLPDFDSVAVEHRRIAERLAGQTDVLVWVVDPQKYADAVLHADFIRPLSAHAAVTAVVLNQVDLLPADQAPRVLDSLRELLRQDGIPSPRVFAASARTGQGVAEVRAEIARFAAERAASTRRLEADLRTLAERVPPAGAGERVPRAARGALVQDLARASGAEEVARAVGRSYAKRAGQATGWPLTSWLLRLRPDPLRRLHLSTGPRRDGRDPDLHRTALPPLDAARQARAARAVRDYADAASQGLGEGWRARIRALANETAERLPAGLDRAIAATDLGARGSWWWVLVGIVQWIALLAALSGVAWYLLAWFLPALGLPGLVQIPLVEGWPVPGLLVAAGVLLGVLLGLAAGALGALVGRARAARARRRLRRAIDELARRELVEPLAAERERAGAFDAAMRTVAGR
ncbi:MAG: 50S ribosome-binding GTPase [Pseudoclavibacter sp.]|nr:50S ribosome-binding GTPase [Pseudoclavibacter sp.]